MTSLETPSPAMYEERIRILRMAFDYATQALTDLGHKEVAENLRARWHETRTPGDPAPEDMQTTRRAEASFHGP